MKIANLTAKKIRLLKRDNTIMEIEPQKIRLRFIRDIKIHEIKDKIRIAYREMEYCNGLERLEKIINEYIDNYDIVILDKEIAEYILIKHLSKKIQIKDINKIFYPWLHSQTKRDGKLIKIVHALYPIASKI